MMRSAARRGLLVVGLFLLPTIVQAQPKLEIPETVTFQPNVEYSHPGDVSLMLDIAYPKEAKDKCPAVLMIHGGGFRAGTRQGYDAFCIKLAQMGYVAATVEYRLAPAYQFPAAVHDCKAALRWLRANAEKYKIDTKRIATMGGSAGGHLAQFLGVTEGVPQFEGTGGNPEQSTEVACVVNVYGPSDFTKSYGRSVDAHEVLPLFLGGNLQQARHNHIVSSPLNWVTPQAAPTICIHGTKDLYVNYEQAVWMVERLHASDVEAVLFTLPEAGHGFKGEDQTKADQAAFDFLNRHLKPVPPAPPKKPEEKKK